MGRSFDLGRAARIVVSILFLIGAAFLAFSSSDRIDIPEFSVASLAAFVCALLTNVFLAGVRFETIANRHGTRIGLVMAMRANAAAALASQFLFAFLGQAAGRAAVLHGSGISASATISLSLIERIIAALVLATAAVFAALFLFGRLTGMEQLDPSYFFRVLVCFLIVAGVALGTVYRGFLPHAARGLFSRTVGEDLLIIGGLSVLVHLAMLAAYVALTVGLGAPLTGELIAACLVVMFAASLPVSFGGWGVREISAGIALSLVGLSTIEGIAIGAAIGVGSLVIQLAVAALSMTRKPVSTRSERELGAGAVRPNYPLWLSLLTPVLASFAVIFGLHLSVLDSVINFNLADPLAVLGSMLFVAYWFEQRRLPHWRVPEINAALLVFSAILTFSALHGYLDFGYSSWGVRNRFVGWFVLLAFMATGALFVARLGKAGPEFLLKGFAAALAVVAALELLAALIAAAYPQITSRSHPYPFEGFSQSASAYAFLLLAGLSIVLALHRKESPGFWVPCGGILVVALVLASSQAAWVAAAIMFLAVAVIDRRSIASLVRMLLAAALFFGAFVGSIALIDLGADSTASLPGGAGLASQIIGGFEVTQPSSGSPEPGADHSSNLTDAWSLWIANPLFGAGLGAFYEQTGAVSGRAMAIHNSFLWVAAEMGLVGLLPFLAGGAYLLLTLWRRLENPNDAAATALFLLLIGFAVMAAVHDLLYQRVLWFIAGACLALPAPKPRRADDGAVRA